MENWKRNMIVLSVGNFIFFLGISMIVPFLPIYVQELGVADPSEAALWASAIFAVNHLFLAVFSPIWGRVSDRIGQKRVLTICGIGMACAVFAMGFVHSPQHLFVLRMVFGIMGGFTVAASSLTAVETPTEHKGKALGFIQSGLVSGQLVGPLFGGVLAGTIGMRSAFYTTGLLMVTAAVIVTMYVRQSRTFAKLSFPNIGIRRQQPSAAMRAEAETGSNSEPSSKYSWKDAFRYPLVPTMFMTSFLFMGSVQSVDPILTLYVQSVIETKHIEFIGGLVFAASALGTVIASPVAGRILDKTGRHKYFIIGGLAMMAVVYVMLAMSDQIWSLVVTRMIFGICMGCIMPASSALLSKLTPKRAQGSVFGYNFGLMSFGSVLGSLSGGALANFSGFSYIFYSVAVILVLHSAFLIFQFRRYEARQMAPR